MSAEEIDQRKNKQNAVRYSLNQGTMLVSCEDGLSGQEVNIFYLFLNIGNKTEGKKKWEHRLFDKFKGLLEKN